MKQVSDKYFNVGLENFVTADGILSKNVNDCELFVDTHYIDYMLSNLNQESQFLFTDMKRKVEENSEDVKRMLQT